MFVSEAQMNMAVRKDRVLFNATNRISVKITSGSVSHVSHCLAPQIRDGLSAETVDRAFLL
jgi:hypothetical protein